MSDEILPQVLTEETVKGLKMNKAIEELAKALQKEITFIDHDYLDWKELAEAIRDGLLDKELEAVELVRKKTPCPDCGGIGYRNDNPNPFWETDEPCKTCKGKGVV